MLKGLKASNTAFPLSSAPLQGRHSTYSSLLLQHRVTQMLTKQEQSWAMSLPQPNSDGITATRGASLTNLSQLRKSKEDRLTACPLIRSVPSTSNPPLSPKCFGSHRGTVPSKGVPSQPLTDNTQLTLTWIWAAAADKMHRKKIQVQPGPKAACPVTS